jgi:hypothetical protein
MNVDFDYDWDSLLHLGYSESAINQLKDLAGSSKGKKDVANPLDEMAVGNVIKPVPATKQLSNFGELSESSLQYARDAYAESVNKDSLPCNKARRTPNHPKKSHMVKACKNGEERLIRFGQQGVKGAGEHPTSAKDKARKKSYYARHNAQDPHPDKFSARYWSHKVKW